MLLKERKQYTYCAGHDCELHSCESGTKGNDLQSLLLNGDLSSTLLQDTFLVCVPKTNIVNV